MVIALVAASIALSDLTDVDSIWFTT